MFAESRSIFEEMDRLRRALDTQVGGALGPMWNLPFSRISFLPGRSARAYPLVNVSERADRYEVAALAPGLDPATLELSFHDRTLTIRGEKTSVADEAASDRIHRLERSGGRFHRAVRISGAVDRDAIRADYRDGILTVTLPKAEAARPRTIDVQVG